MAILKYRKGDRRPPMPLEMWNGIVDVLAWFRSGVPKSDGPSPGSANPFIVNVRNNGSDTIEIYRGIGLDDLAIEAEDDGKIWSRDIVFEGSALSDTAHARSWAVAQEPIPAGGIGRAVFLGLTKCRVTVTNKGADYVGVVEGKLATTGLGTGRIRWMQSDPNASAEPPAEGAPAREAWALVELGADPGVRAVKLTSSLAKDAGATADVWYWNADDGEWQETGEKIDVRDWVLSVDESVASGSRGGVEWLGGAWVLTSAQCEPDPEEEE